MDEITGPVIATTLVLLAVFVPTAFMGGITGQLYRQFALTISGAVVISTINALTLSPALCGLLLRPATPAATRATQTSVSGKVARGIPPADKIGELRHEIITPVAAWGIPDSDAPGG